MGAKERINILMVDDSPTNLLALESILQAADRNLVSASSGDDALRYLLDHEVSVILMDVYMPGLDGLETAELIRGRDRSRNIPIIFLTADSTGGRHLSRGYSLGAVDYIVKPIEPDILRSKVNVFVELSKKTWEIKRQADLLEEKNQELEQANLERLKMLIDLGQQLAAQHEPAHVLEGFCRSARKIMEAQEAGVGIINVPGSRHGGSNGNSLNFSCRCTAKDEEVSSDEVPAVIERALKYMVTKRRPLRLTDSDDLLRTDGKTSELVHCFLGAPLLSSRGVCGWVYVLNKLDAEEFSEADERLAATLATQVVVAYENAVLYSGAQKHASELQLEITERKQAESARAQMLLREQAARADAEQANRTKDEFLATLSHELRTPLSAILGWSHLVRTGKLNEPQMSRAFETIERNARSQSQLIDDLLDVSRIITGKLQIEPQPVDLCQVIEDSIEGVRPALEAKNIQLETRLEAAGCFVLGEANRLQQVFWNLLSNAVKFTRENGNVRVEVSRVGEQVQVSVSDSGIGITPEFLPHIFDRFRQADGSTTRVHGGLGLGLSIVKHLVLLHRGDVKVESAGKDQGATFVVSLPVSSQVSADEIEKQRTMDQEGDRLPANFSTLLEGVRILVVDDEADSRELVAAILTRCGAQVRSCESAEEALKVFALWKPDVLVSDIGMPKEDGYSLIKKLRKLRLKLAKEIPAVALTAYATDDDRSRALAAGFQTHVAKPIEPEALVKSIADAAGRQLAT
ncbi:MAG TPA: response regulator [Pyrinomonadaceae bacterium]|jgi:signal transduction histidine kinase/PleD family two-component response regulator|nr:response regulator [Pyrinomonadaceae bacterium]